MGQSSNLEALAPAQWHLLKPEITVIPVLSRDLEGAGLRGPRYRLGGCNDGRFANQGAVGPGKKKARRLSLAF